MSSGTGRGRGWLHLNKSAPSRPGMPTTNNALSPVNNFNDVPVNNTDQFNSSSEYASLINKLKQLNVNDDGILFNQKIKYILESWDKECGTGDEVEKSFDAIHQASLIDADLASKLVLMVSSRSFINQQLHEQNIRGMFLQKLQQNFESSKQLQESNPNAFRNSVHMLGQFFSKARLANGQQLNFMATPILSYLEMLLESSHPQDLKLFATQLYMNGASLKSECPEKIADILNTVRLNLSDGKISNRECRLWLLLALDVANNRFGILPSEIHQFYQNQLGDSALASFQGTHGTLSVQTNHASKNLDGYQSNVNVLQVSSPPPPQSSSSSSLSENQNVKAPPPANSPPNNDLNNTSSSGFVSDSSIVSNRSIHGNNREKKAAGRPILGAGARLNKKSYLEEQNNHNSVGGWGKPKSSGANWAEKKSPSKSKGWEHDDRFETDYS